MRAGEGVDTDVFYRTVYEEYGALVGPGRWFEQPDRFFRIGYGWPTPAELEGGLEAVSRALRTAGGGDP
ncbi:MAG: hypothetical protein H0X27_02255 [Caulobacteraceae bacterium]|nr:hypothetical protein [Caulobacteraceae bacterium]